MDLAIVSADLTEKPRSSVGAGIEIATGSRDYTRTGDRTVVALGNGISAGNRRDDQDKRGKVHFQV
jgi:hypothetical protein